MEKFAAPGKAAAGAGGMVEPAIPGRSWTVLIGPGFVTRLPRVYDDLIMPSMTHEGLVTLFRECPDLAVTLAGPRIAVPAEARARVTSAELSELQPSEFRADVVVEILDRAGELDSAAIVEVQLGPDKDKEYTWPHYVTGFRAQRRCNVTLVVVAITEKIARWCERIIETGHPGFALKPVVIGPELIPVITEAEAATRLPELAVLSVAAHGNEPDAERIALAALER